MLTYLQKILIVLLAMSITGYILAVLREKKYLKNNTIVINKRSVTKEHLEEPDKMEFAFHGNLVRAGDEVKIILKNNKKIEGIILGAKIRDRAILMVTHSDEIKRLNVEKIEKFKVISRYGKFFKTF